VKDIFILGVHVNYTYQWICAIVRTPPLHHSQLCSKDIPLGAHLF